MMPKNVGPDVIRSPLFAAHVRRSMCSFGVLGESDDDSR